MANGDDIAATDEQMRFAEDDFVILHMRSPGDDEHRVPIDLQFRALVGLCCVLDRQRMEIELGLNLVQQHFIRLVQADPDDGILPASPFAGLFDPDVPNALPMLVNGGSHDTGPFKRRRCRTAPSPLGNTVQILQLFQSCHPPIPTHHISAANSSAGRARSRS